MFHAEWCEKWAKRPRRKGKLGWKSRRVNNKVSWGWLQCFLGVWEGVIRKLGAILEKVQRFLENLPRF